MTDERAFAYLFEIAATSKDPDGVVAAALVYNDKILFSSTSADDGLTHAEQFVIEDMYKSSYKPSVNDVLYCTLEPCARRSKDKNHLSDCCSLIIECGIKKVIYGADDPVNKDLAKQKLKDNNVDLRRTTDSEISKTSLILFNSTIADSSKLKPLF